MERITFFCNSGLWKDSQLFFSLKILILSLVIMDKITVFRLEIRTVGLDHEKINLYLIIIFHYCLLNRVLNDKCEKLMSGLAHKRTDRLQL